jgi:uncharacterized damage-inducible protein DinB
VARLEEIVRPPWPTQGTERFILTTMLAFHRATLAMKCQGLDDVQLATRSISTSNLTLLGLLRHMTEVERYWFEEMFDGLAPAPFYDNSIDPDADFNDLDSAPVSLVIDRWLERATLSDACIATHDLESSGVGTIHWTGQRVTMRFIVVHLIDEYARHCGHADLLREAIDGSRGH